MERNTRSRKSSAKKKTPAKADSDSDYEDDGFDDLNSKKVITNDGWIKKSKTQDRKKKTNQKRNEAKEERKKETESS